MTAGPPPLHWIWGDAAARKAWRRYWIRDVLRGWNAIFWHHLLSAGGIDWCSEVGATLGLASGRLQVAAARRVRESLKRLRPDLAADLDSAQRRVWSNMGRALAEVSVQPRIWDSDRTRVVGEEHILAARASGRGRIYITLHMAAWELIGPKLMEYGERGHVFYLPQPNRFRARIADKLRSGFPGVMLPPTAESARRVLRGLKNEDKTFIMLVDEVTGGRVQFPAFDRPLDPDCNLAKIVRMAQMSGALVVPLYVIRQGGARFEMHVMAPVDLADLARDEAGLQTGMARLNALLEPAVIANLEQWFMLPALDLEAG